MAEGAVTGVGPNGPPQARRRRQLLLLLLPRRRWGTYGGGCFRSLRGLSVSSAGFRGLPPSSSVGLRGLSRASPLLLLFLLPSPRLAAAVTPRRHLGDWERSHRRPRETSGSRSPAEDPGTRAPAPTAPGPSSSDPGLGCGGRLRWCKSCLVPSVADPRHLCSVSVLAPARRDLSISASSQQKENKLPVFTSSGSKKLFFDTHAVVLLLEEKGFTTQQAEIIVSALVKIMNSNMELVNQDMVTKVHQYSLNERKLLEMRSEVLTLQAQQLRALTQTDRKIDTEVAGLKTMLESHKLDNIKYLAGSIFTCLTVALGFYRLWI
ncbi:mitochondrial calcium uniporter regulator 1 isoform X3 [Petaurus breviceps papuanus]|uniref:mitochondrial calcium uniporter regulator 1 isoform X3 n=1 Tax=Petaurus breviceps papuanus TaxID=3040969 RepID=UPI0036D9E1CC